MITEVYKIRSPLTTGNWNALAKYFQRNSAVSAGMLLITEDKKELLFWYMLIGVLSSILTAAVDCCHRAQTLAVVDFGAHQ